MREALLFMIQLYKRFFSPYKGFRCAYRVNTGRASCSSLGYRAIRLHGAYAGLAILKKRTQRCAVAQHRNATRVRPLAAQRGDCDPGCIPCDLDCDLPSPRFLSQFGNALSCCDCGSCDWSTRKGKTREQKEKYVYIPPKASRKSQVQSQERSRPET